MNAGDRRGDAHHPLPPCPDDLPYPGDDRPLRLVDDTSSADKDWLGDDDHDENGRRIPGTNPHDHWLHPAARPSSRRRARAMQRRRRILDLRAEGLAFAEIARHLGFGSVEGCRQAYRRALDDVREVAEEHRDLQLARLEEAIRVLMPLVRTGDLKAVDRLVKVIDRIARLAGLDKVPPHLSVSPDTTADGPESVRAVTALLAAYPHLLQPAARVVDGEPPDGSGPRLG
jgi:hypothetical protein